MNRLVDLKKLIALFVFAWLAVAGVTTGRADQGVFDDRIVLGQSAALEGPAAALGRDFTQGIELAFAEANRAGGVHGRQLRLISRDDGYEPLRAIANTEALLGQDRVFALIGEVGTPTARATVPIAQEQGVPFIAPFTGAEFLRDSKWTSVINIRASYNQEAERGIEYLVSELGFKRIAVLFQDDTFGRDGLNAVRAALQRRSLDLVGDATYKRNTSAVKRAVLHLRDLAPEAVFIIGAYAPAAEFIRISQAIGFKPRFMALSFVGTVTLSEALGASGNGVLITQVMPPYEDRSRPLVSRFRQALTDYAPDINASFVVLEGYLAGRLTIATLELLGENPSRKGFLSTLRTGKLSQLDGLQLNFSAESNQGSDHVYLTEIGPDGNITEVAPK